MGIYEVITLKQFSGGLNARTYKSARRTPTAIVSPASKRIDFCVRRNLPRNNSEISELAPPE